MRRLLAGLLTVALIGVAAPAHAATVTVPRHTSDSQQYVNLYGATGAGFVLERGDWPETQLLTGPSGTTLTAMTRPDWEALGASGNYAWYRSENRAHRVDLRTRATTSYPMSGIWLAWTPDGWITHTGSAIQRTVAGGATTTIVPNIDTAANLVEAAADGTGAVLLYDQVKNGVRDRYVSLVTWGKAGVETVWTQSQGSVYALQLLQVALTSSTVVFVTTTTLGGNGYFVHTRPRAGGAITTTRLADDLGAYSVAAAGSAVAFPGPGNAVAVLSGGAWHDVALPGPGAQLQSTGSTFAIGVSGKNTVAGVYTFGATGGATRAATLPTAPAVPRSAILSAGYLTYADDAVAVAPRGGSLWRRPVGGAETRLSVPVDLGDGAYSDAAVRISAARGLIRKPSAAREFQLLDRGVVTRTLPTPLTGEDRYQISGPYAAIGGQVYRTDGTLAFDADNGGKLALFGKTLIYQNGANQIVLRDLEKSTSTTLATSGICDDIGNCGYGIAAWHDTVAWQRADTTIAVRTVSTGATRIVRPGVQVFPLRLSDNALSWNDGSDTKVVDLGSSTSTPVTLAGLRNSTVDGHLAAGINDAGQVETRTLPFSRTAPVKLIGTLAPAGFTTTWAPQFDLTKPAIGVKLTIKSGTTTVRTLTGTAPDGSIRDLVWDGKNTAGTRVAAGNYTYQLTATATDGEGALSTVTGTVTVK